MNTDYPPDFTVRDGIWDAETKIGRIEKHRHTAIFPKRDGGETILTFCNNCGGSFILNNHCSECGMPE